MLLLATKQESSVNIVCQFALSGVHKKIGLPGTGLVTEQQDKSADQTRGSTCSTRCSSRNTTTNCTRCTVNTYHLKGTRSNFYYLFYTYSGGALPAKKYFFKCKYEYLRSQARYQSSVDGYNCRSALFYWESWSTNHLQNFVFSIHQTSAVFWRQIFGDKLFAANKMKFNNISPTKTKDFVLSIW